MAGEPRRSVIAALIGNASVAATKYIAAAISGSSAMLAEAIHSTADSGNQLLLLLGLHQAKKPADRLHPFGRGKEIYFWSLIVAVILFGLGGGVSIYEGILAFLGKGHPLENVLVNYVVLGLAAVLEGYALRVALQEFWKHKGDRGVFEAIHTGKDPTFLVVMFEDGAALLGIATAALGIFLTWQTGDPAYDAAASVIIGLILSVVAFWLAYESKGLLVGESADPRMVQRVDEIATQDPAIEQATRVLTMHIGPDDILVTMDLQFKPGLTADELHRAVERIERRVREEFPRVTNLFIEMGAFAGARPQESGVIPNQANEPQ